MKINIIIKEKRMEQNLTQEQVANCLGVSTPAVNKWEKGVSYPDITILPPLARLLRVDLNTLLSFNDDLTDKEISDFINSSMTDVFTDGFDIVFKKCMDKIQYYPTCYKLILSISLSLMGAMYIFNVENKETYKEKLYSLYERCASCNELEIKNHAISLLINKCLEEKQYDEAQKYIDVLPNVTYDKAQLQGNLYVASKQYDKANQVFESRLLQIGTQLSMNLTSMMGVAISEKRDVDALNVAKVIAKSTELLELWDYGADSAYFELYAMNEDSENLISTLEKMLPKLQNKWNTSETKLYKHIKATDCDDNQNVFLQGMLEMLKNEPSLDFVRQDPKFIMLMRKMEGQIDEK